MFGFPIPRYSYNGILDEAAAAWLTANETPSIELAPSLPLLLVPSRSINLWSMTAWSITPMPTNADRISVLTLVTAVNTPLPPNLLSSWSLSSTASWAPVLAPEGTHARPKDPSSKYTSTSTVGLERESKISRAFISDILTNESSCLRDYLVSILS